MVVAAVVFPTLIVAWLALTILVNRGSNDVGKPLPLLTVHMRLMGQRMDDLAAQIGAALMPVYERTTAALVAFRDAMRLPLPPD